MALTKLPGFTLDTSSNVTFANANVTGNLTSGNVAATGNIDATNLTLTGNLIIGEINSNQYSTTSKAIAIAIVFGF